MTGLLIEQVASQRTWPKVGDIDDCWVLAWLMCQIGVAPWLPWWDVAEARKFAGDPDDGKADGNDAGVEDLLRGVRTATPAFGELCAPIRGSWDFDRLLDALKGDSTIDTVRPFAAAVMGGSLPKVYTRVPHQVVFFHEPGVGLRCADPMAPDRSEPYRITKDEAIKALASFAGAGKVVGVLFPSRAQTAPLNPLARAGGGVTEAEVTRRVADAVAAAKRPLEARIRAIKEEVNQTALTVARL